jgi:hypothetical protein
MTLAQFLIQAGYRQIPLATNGVGHFQAAGALNGRPIAVLIDTGASSTVLSLDVVRDLGLDAVLKAETTGGGAGGKHLEVFQVPEADLLVAGMAPRCRKPLLAMDFCHVNQALALKGSAPIEAVLGVDVLAAQAAVIDYGGSALFLHE